MTTVSTAFEPLKSPMPREASSDAFISYSRKDQPFVRTLNAAFKQLNRDPVG